MEGQTIENGRVRAWVLLRTDDPERVARELYDELGHEGGDEYVVVRADVVGSFYNYNIVVPVDAQGEDALGLVVERIRNLKAVKGIAVLRVDTHNPYPPHVAHGYISDVDLETQQEKGIEIEEEVRPGRQGASPGLNPWG